MRLHSFHKTTQDQVHSPDMDQNEQRTLEEQQQLAAEPTDPSGEGANVTKAVESIAAKDQPNPESTSEQTDIQPPAVSKFETQLSSREEGRVDSVSEFAVDQQSLEQRPATATSSQFSQDVSNLDSQGNPFVPLPVLDASTETNPLSPFIPKRHSMEKERPTSDLIQLGDDLEPDVNTVATASVAKESVGAATPSEEVQLTEEANKAHRIERSLSNARQPSMESDHSVVCINVYITVYIFNNAQINITFILVAVVIHSRSGQKNCAKFETMLVGFRACYFYINLRKH